MPEAMTVKELIELLSSCDENAMVALMAGNECDAYLEIVSEEKLMLGVGIEHTVYKPEKTLWSVG